MNNGDGFFKFVFAVIFMLILVAIGASVFLNVECYRSGNPDSMACYMISDRHEIGVRNR